MSEKLVNSFISSLIGCLSAIGTVWFLSEENAENERSETTKFSQIEVDSLKINDRLIVSSLQAPERPLVEIQNGTVLAQGGVFAENIGGLQLTGQKIKVTSGDPTRTDSPVFSEISINDEGGAYFALLSPQGTHSMNFGFDKMETGFIISQNNQDRSMLAQAILPIPRAENASVPVSAEKPSSESSPVENETGFPIDSPNADSADVAGHSDANGENIPNRSATPSIAAFPSISSNSPNAASASISANSPNAASASVPANSANAAPSADVPAFPVATTNLAPETAMNSEFPPIPQTQIR